MKFCQCIHGNCDYLAREGEGEGEETRREREQTLTEGREARESRIKMPNKKTDNRKLQIRRKLFSILLHTLFVCT